MLAFQTFTASFGFRQASRDQNHRHSQTKKYPPAAEDLLEAGALGLVEAPKKSRSDASSPEEAKAGQFSVEAIYRFYSRAQATNLHGLCLPPEKKSQQLELGIDSDLSLSIPELASVDSR